MYKEQTQDQKDARKKAYVCNLLDLFDLELSNLSSLLNEDYKEEEKTSDYILLQSHDPIDIEKITLGYYLNQWGAPRFYAQIQRFDRSNDEVTTEDSFGCLWSNYDPKEEDEADCPEDYAECENCDNFKNGCTSQYAKDMEYATSNKPHEDVTEWCNKPKKFMSPMGTDLEYSHIADSFVCHNNITHYHTVKGYEFRIESQHLDEIINVIHTRNLWFRVEPFLSKEAEV